MENQGNIPGEIADRILVLTKQDIILWYHKTKCEYSGFANGVTFTVICSGKSRQLAVGNHWLTIPLEVSDNICKEIALQSRRLAPDVIKDRLVRAGLWE